MFNLYLFFCKYCSKLISSFVSTSFLPLLLFNSLSYIVSLRSCLCYYVYSFQYRFPTFSSLPILLTTFLFLPSLNMSYLFLPPFPLPLSSLKLPTLYPYSPLQYPYSVSLMHTTLPSPFPSFLCKSILRDDHTVYFQPV